MRRKRLRPLAPVLKAGLIGVATLVVTAAALTAAIPLLLANDRIKDGIRAELASLSGLPVAINGGISVSVFPVFIAKLENVVIGTDASAASVKVKMLEAELSWFAALGEHVQMQAVNIDGADIKLSSDANGQWLPAALASPLAPILLKARQAMAANPAKPDFSFLPDWRIGSITLRNSKIRVTGAGGSQNLISALDVRAVWPGFSEPLQVTGAGVWRGQEFTLSANVGNPVQMAAGGSGGLKASFGSDKVTFDFDGVANLNPVFFANGDVKFETASMGDLLEWLGAQMDAGASMGRMALIAKLVTKDGKMNFDDAAINFNGNPAKGVFELSQTADMPSLSGTIAFDELDLASFLEAFSIGTNPSTTRSGVRFLDQINLDLRLSASFANAGALPLTEVAAAVRIKNGSADFDLGDAGLYGGRAQANLTLSEGSGLPDGHLRVRLSGINLAQIAVTGSVPVTSAPADGMLEIKGKYAGLLPFFKEADGDASVQFGKGEIRSFDGAAFLSRLDAGQIFNLPDIYKGSAGLNGASATATITDGVVILSGAALDLNAGMITLSGALPFFSRGIALSGEMTGAASPTSRRFFVGGSWEQPFVTPINQFIQNKP
jgi:AsmA protein